jgi:hypothetical protein
MKRSALAVLLMLPLAGAALGAGDQPYAGQDARAIASLSQADVDAILAGQGWGLAKPAELNGYPGPLHVLEEADALELTEEQRGAVQAIYYEMKADAQEAGAAYVAAEEHLSMMFRMGHATPERLQAMLGESAGALATLRQVHLAAHLKVTPLLTEAQKAAYADLRGYGAGGGHGDHSGHEGH